MVDPHAIEVAVVGGSPEVLEFGSVGKEAHALQPTISESLIDCDGDVVGEELVEDGSEHVHTCILPEPSLMVEDLVSHDISNCG